MTSLPVRASLITAALLVGWSLSALPAAAHEGQNHGTVKVHDDEVVDPPQRNQPHVSCELWIEGFDMSDDAGHLEFIVWPPTDDSRAVVLTSNWTADSGNLDDGWHFLAGPFELEGGHYRLEAFVDQGHPGTTEHFAKAKVFWVEPCVPEEPPQELSLPCPPDLVLTAEEDGDVHLGWNPIAGADQYQVLRSQDGADFEILAVVTDTQYTDTETALLTSYDYRVLGVSDSGLLSSGPGCEGQVRTIPEFPDPVLVVPALAGGVLALAVLRRRP